MDRASTGCALEALRTGRDIERMTDAMVNFLITDCPWGDPQGNAPLIRKTYWTFRDNLSKYGAQDAAYCLAKMGTTESLQYLADAWNEDCGPGATQAMSELYVGDIALWKPSEWTWITMMALRIGWNKNHLSLLDTWQPPARCESEFAIMKSWIQSSGFYDELVTRHQHVRD